MHFYGLIIQPLELQLVSNSQILGRSSTDEAGGEGMGEEATAQKKFLQQHFLNYIIYKVAW
jgi:hypothetical protein